MRKLLGFAIVLVLAIVGGAAWHVMNRPSEEMTRKMYWAVRNGELPVIKELLGKNKRLAQAEYKGEHSMIVTAACTYSPIPNQTEVCRILLENGADPNESYGSPLHGAIYCWNTDLVKLLLKHGADPHIKPKAADGKTPYEDAKWRETNDIVKLFDEWKK